MTVKITTNVQQESIEASPTLFKPDDIVSVRVIGEGYVRYGSSNAFDLTYDGPAFEVVREIAGNHSYSQFEDYETFEQMIEDSDYKTVDDMLKVLDEYNGDGCDHISSITNDQTSAVILVG